MRRLIASSLVILFSLSAAADEPISLDQKIGQLLMVSLPEGDLDSEAMAATLENITAGRIGAVIFFNFNIREADAFRTVNAHIASLAKPYPLLMAIDEEGGRVRRLRKRLGYREFPGARKVAEKLTPIAAHGIYLEMADQIADLHLNVNLAPVVDLDIRPSNPVIGRLGRSFSDDPQVVMDYARAFIDAHRELGVLTVLKHYPGHGSSKGDSHAGITEITHTWRPVELVPFRNLIEANEADMIMTGHLLDRNVDAELPASLSQQHVQVRLRDDLGFDGVVITDDLQMGAIVDEYSLEERIVLALESSSDILQFSDPASLADDFPREFATIVKDAIATGQLTTEQIDAAFQRVITLKYRLIDPAGIPMIVNLPYRGDTPCPVDTLSLP